MTIYGQAAASLTRHLGPIGSRPGCQTIFKATRADASDLQQTEADGGEQSHRPFWLLLRLGSAPATS
jgi:hypothetical protein